MSWQYGDTCFVINGACPVLCEQLKISYMYFLSHYCLCMWENAYRCLSHKGIHWLKNAWHSICCLLHSKSVASPHLQKWICIRRYLYFHIKVYFEGRHVFRLGKQQYSEGAQKQLGNSCSLRRKFMFQPSVLMYW